MDGQSAISRILGRPGVPGLPIRDCTGSSNNLVPRIDKVSAIDVTAKASFDRLYLVSCWGTIGKICHHVLCAPGHIPTSHTVTISRFRCLSFKPWPLNVCVSMIRLVIWTSPGTPILGSWAKHLGHDDLTTDIFQSGTVFAHSKENLLKTLRDWWWGLVSPRIHASPPTLWAVLPTRRGSDWVCPKLGMLWSSVPGQFLGS